MNILHVVPLIQASTGGPAVSVTRLATEQAKMGHQLALACLDYKHLGSQVDAPGVRIVSVEGNAASVNGRGWSRALRKAVRAEAGRADIVHNHGLWMWPNAYAREAAVALARPLVISTRGMLEPWSLRRSRVRKAVAWHLFEKKNLKSARLFHATAEGEAVSIAGATGRLTSGGSQNRQAPVVVAPNGVDLPDLSAKPDRTVLEDRFPKLKGKRWFVFMSRLHPKKGIDLLLRAWASRKKDGAVLVLAGPDLVGYRREAERLVAELELHASVVLTGEVREEVKDCLLAHAEVFVLPSHSENFGIVVAEALSWARPVIATTGTPWRQIAEAGAGWYIDADEGELARVLHESLEKSALQLQEMGAKGRAVVAGRYTWRAQAAALIGAYEGLLTRGNESLP